MSGAVLKIIALAAMIVDHTGVAFQFAIDSENLRGIGRIAFPIYVFLIGEGCHHTKDMKKYLLRLGIFALVSELPFDFLSANTRIPPSRLAEHVIRFFDPSRQNVFFTLFLGVFAVYLYENRKDWNLRFRNPFLYWPVWAAILAGGLLHTDYGVIGVGSIVAVWQCKEKRRQILVLLLMIAALYTHAATIFYFKMFSCACLSLVCVYFYNGRRGSSFKLLFYAMYPLHLSVLGAVWYFYIRPLLLLNY